MLDKFKSYIDPEVDQYIWDHPHLKKLPWKEWVPEIIFARLPQVHSFEISAYETHLKIVTMITKVNDVTFNPAESNRITFAIEANVPENQIQVLFDLLSRITPSLLKRPIRFSRT